MKEKKSTDESNMNLDETIHSLIQLQKGLSESLRLAMPKIRRVSESVRPVMEQIISFAENFSPMAENLRNHIIEDLPRRIIGYQLAFRVWPLNDLGLIDHLIKNKNIPDKLNEGVIQFYRENCWRNLMRVVDQWRNSKIASDRLSILRDCFHGLQLIAQENHNINAANVIVPALVCQFEGIICDNDKKIIEKFKNMTKNVESPLEIIDHGYGLFPFIVGNVFMTSSQFAEKKEKRINRIGINRDKIAHGDKMLLDYGKEETLVRMFLYIDAAIHFVAEDSLRKGVQSDSIH